MKDQELISACEQLEEENARLEREAASSYEKGYVEGYRDGDSDGRKVALAEYKSEVLLMKTVTVTVAIVASFYLLACTSYPAREKESQEYRQTKNTLW